MKLKLNNFQAYDPYQPGDSPMIGADLAIVFKEGSDQITGSIGTSFDHPNPRALTFEEAEKLAIEHVLSQM
ncbi:hypothetical protein [Pseudomonas putida]